MNIWVDVSFWIELGLVVLGVAASLVAPNLGSRILAPLRSLAAWFERKPRLSLMAAFLIAPALRVLASPFVRLPYPFVHDEFSYLLMGDTFASGRLTNPTHPFWIHFETVHVLQKPTYASPYPVMQGIFLAVGELVAHAPWLGVWISMALLCGALYWMLKAWLPTFWALAGTALFAVRFSIFTYWMNSYWGGAPAALGGALVLGALPRVFRSPRICNALWLAIGLAILANSRPYEGFSLCLPVAFVFVAWLLGGDQLLRWFGFRPLSHDFRAKLRVVVPVVLVLGVTGAFMSYYFWRVTGNPLKIPQVAEAEQYSITPLFVWQKLRPAPHYDTDTLWYFFTQWSTQKTPQTDRFLYDWRFYLGPALTVPLVLGAFAFRDRRMRFMLVVVLVVLLAVAAVWWSQPHYPAPVTAAIFALVLQCMRHMRVNLMRTRSAPTRWRGLVTLTPLVVLAMIPVRLVLPKMRLEQRMDIPYGAPTLYLPERPRSQAERFLMKQGPKHLVFVRYTNHMNDALIHDEWVYNSANIDRQPIIWARELDEDHNRQLREYYNDRKVWLCSPDEGLLEPMQ